MDFGPTKAFDGLTGKFIGWDHDLIVIKGGKTFDDLTITDNADGNAVVTGYGEDASVTLEGVSASELTESDFDFLGRDLPHRNRRTGRHRGQNRGKAGDGGLRLNQRRQTSGRTIPCERLSGTFPRPKRIPRQNRTSACTAPGSRPAH